MTHHTSHITQDHLNDIMSNMCAILTAVAAGFVPNGWYIDPAGVRTWLRARSVVVRCCRAPKRDRLVASVTLPPPSRCSQVPLPSPCTSCCAGWQSPSSRCAVTTLPGGHTHTQSHTLTHTGLVAVTLGARGCESRPPTRCRSRTRAWPPDAPRHAQMWRRAAAAAPEHRPHTLPDACHTLMPATRATPRWQQVDKLVGRGAPAAFVAQLEELASSHHEAMGLDVLRAYHYGARCARTVLQLAVCVCVAVCGCVCGCVCVWLCVCVAVCVCVRASMLSAPDCTCGLRCTWRTCCQERVCGVNHTRSSLT
jgi:hypothetical protein